MLEIFRASLIPTQSPDSKLEAIGNWSGLIGLYLFSFFALLSIAGANLGLVLMGIGLIFSRRAWRDLFKQPITWLCLLIIIYILVRAVWSLDEISADQDTQINQTRDWVQLFLFFIPAWWMSQSRHRIPISIGLMFSGFAFGMLSALDSETLAQAMQGVRSGLHFGKPIILGFDCAAAILGLTALGMYWLDEKPDTGGHNTPLRLGLILFGLLFYTQGLIISQSRGVWLAILFALPVLFITLRYAAPPHQHRPVRLRYALISLLVVMAVTLALNWNTVSQRVTSETNEWSAIVNEGLDKAPLGSSSYRLHLWKFGLRKWLERPFFGWGPGTTHALVEAENDITLQDPPGSSFDHLHNAYLEVVFQLGMFGIVLVALISGVIMSKLMESYQHKKLSIYFLAFLMSNFTLIAIYSLTDFRHLHWNWRFYWLIIAGATLAIGLTQRPPAQRPEHEQAD
jgi:O-antigen ligase